MWRQYWVVWSGMDISDSVTYAGTWLASAGASGWALVFRLLEADLENAGRVVREVTMDDVLPHEIGCPGISV